ncbi:MAG: ArsR/SmtB family transcription factor [Pseudonocardiaceae bacterium]
MESAGTGETGLERTVAALARRVDRLEAQQDTPARVDPDEPLWAVQALRRRQDDVSGRVVFAGVVGTPEGGEYIWQQEYRAAALAAENWGEIAPMLAALGHPIRLALLRAVHQGTRTIKELVDLPGVGTSGQVYHHLRDLQGAGWIRLERRNYYSIPPDRVVPLLVVLAAGGLGSQPAREASD